VLHNQDSLSSAQPEAAPKPHDTGLAFGKEGTSANRAGCLVRDDDPSDRRSNNDVHPVVSEFRGEGTADEVCVLGVLKNESALEINRAVQPGGELKVTIQKRTGLLEQIEQVLLIVNHAYSYLEIDVIIASTSGTLSDKVNR